MQLEAYRREIRRALQSPTLGVTQAYVDERELVVRTEMLRKASHVDLLTLIPDFVSQAPSVLKFVLHRPVRLRVIFHDAKGGSLDLSEFKSVAMQGRIAFRRVRKDFNGNYLITDDRHTFFEDSGHALFNHGGDGSMPGNFQKLWRLATPVLPIFH